MKERTDRGITGAPLVPVSLRWRMARAAVLYRRAVDGLQGGKDCAAGLAAVRGALPLWRELNQRAGTCRFNSLMLSHVERKFASGELASRPDWAVFLLSNIAVIHSQVAFAIAGRTATVVARFHTQRHPGRNEHRLPRRTRPADPALNLETSVDPVSRAGKLRGHRHQRLLGASPVG